MTRKSWRDILPVHPAADVFPMMTKEELKALGNDIKENGLRETVAVLYTDAGEAYVVDGRNRLDAMELVGVETVGENGLLLEAHREFLRCNSDQIPAYVIAANIRRRHLTKKQQADLIVKVVEAGKIGLAKSARSIGGAPEGKKGGSTKDPVKEKVVQEAAKLGISKRTAEQSLADAKPKSDRVYVTCPECSAQTAALDKHMATKHKVKTPKQPTKAQIAKAGQAMDDLQKFIAKGASRTTVRQLEKALMNAQQATGSISVYEVLADKAALKQMLRLYDQLEESITLGREKIKNRPPDKEIKRALSGGTSIKKLGP